MTDFARVCDFNKCFDFPIHNNMNDDKCRKLRIDLIEEELNELKEAFKNNDEIEQQDACIDILYVAYGMAYTYNINSDYVMFTRYLIFKNDTLFKSCAYNVYDKETMLNIIFETFEKLKEATNNKDFNGVVDHLHQLIYEVYNYQVIGTYDSDKNFTIVHNSNMSKLCKTKAEAEATVKDYQQKYNNGTSPYDSPYYYKLDNGYYVVKNKSTGKALKSINYTPVKL